MSKDSRKSTEWFDAQLRKAKDDFTELARGRPDLRSREPAKRPIERESKPFEPPVKTDTTQARETIPGGQALQKMLPQELVYLMMSMFSMRMVHFRMFRVVRPGLKPGRQM